MNPQSSNCGRDTPLLCMDDSSTFLWPREYTCLFKQDKELRLMATQVQHLMASLHDIEALATAVKADAAQSCKASLPRAQQFIPGGTLACCA